MASRYKTIDQSVKDGIPGPGQYQISREDSVPKIRFGTASRTSLDDPKKKYIPGPGQYR